MHCARLYGPALLALATTVCVPRLFAQPTGYSGLVGRELAAEAADVGSVLGDLLLSRHKGQITKAVVREDRERLLEVEVSYAGADLSQPKLLTGEVQGPRGAAQPVTAQDVPLSAPSGTLRLRLELQDRVARGTSLDSTKLVLRIRGSGAKYDTAATFALPKRWAAEVLPENVVVNVTPAAVGTIPATDPAAASPPVTPKIIRPEMMIFLAAPIATTHTATPAPTPAPQPRVMMRADAVRISPAAMGNLRRLPPVTESAGLPPAVVDKGGRGPSSQALRLFDTVRSAPGLGLNADKITSINADLYRDANPASGIFYYLPARYTLYWETDNGYGLRFLYGASAQPDAPGSVSVTARLTSGIDPQEVEVVKNLLRTALQASHVPFTDLRPFPFAGTPSFSFKDDLRRFNIPAEKISISAISDLAGEVDLAFVTDTVTKDMLELTLTEGLGLTGTATFASASSGEQGFSRTIPVQLRVADPRSFGTVYWKRGELVANTTPFPLRLRHVHFLTMGSDGTPTVYSYSLGNIELAPRAHAHVEEAPVQAWLDRAAVRAWVDYGVREDYPAGIESAKNEWNGGLGQLSTTQLRLTTLTPFSEPGGIARIVVDVKSKYFEPQARADAVRSVTLTRDNDTATIGPLFLVNRSLDDIGRAGDPLFSFRISLVKPDGEVAGPGGWSNGDRLEVFLGSRHVRALLGIDPPAPPSPAPGPTPTPTAPSPQP